LGHDLFIVFTFTYPVMTQLADSRRGYRPGRFSGLGRNPAARASEVAAPPPAPAT